MIKKWMKHFAEYIGSKNVWTLSLEDKVIDIEFATSLKSRCRGLMGRTIPQRLLLIPNCKCVHTFGMSCPLTIYALNSRLKICAKKDSLVPNRIWGSLHAQYILEVPTHLKITNEELRKIHRFIFTKIVGSKKEMMSYMEKEYESFKS
ncbi:DUF192 domain-containing protein [Basilea psittacipulmonis]|nr:DUF192 domain-containing protein [Basilea psittacipulmonis]